MNRNEVIKHLKAHMPELKRRYNIVDLALFGSISRNTGGPDSDIDILVRFDGPATSSQYFGLQFYLEDLLGAPVDLVTDKAVRRELRPFIERDAIHVGS